MGIPSDVLGSGSFGQVNGPSSVSSTNSTSSSKNVKKTGYSSIDSISASDIEAMAMMWKMNVPALVPPDYYIASAKLKISEIATKILDSWVKSLEKQSIERKERESSPSYLAKMEQERSNRLGLIKNMRDYIKELQKEGNESMIGTITHALVITGTYTGIASVNDVVSTPLVSVTPQINFATTFATESLKSIPNDFRAQLGLVAAWGIGTLLNYSTVETLVEKPVGKPFDERILADKYATKILALLGTPELNNFIMAMLVNKTEKGAPLTDGRKLELSSILKVVLLASALASVYKSKTGKVTDQEFLDLISGKMKPEKGIESDLVKAIQNQLSEVKNPDEKLRILEALAEYMDKDPKLEALFDVGATFDNVNHALQNLSPIKT